MSGTRRDGVRVARIEAVPAGAAIVVEVQGQRIAIFNVAGALYAIEDTCTHEEASLAEGWVEGEVVECPRHGARFNLRTGEVVSMPAVRGVRTYPVWVEDGEIKLALDGA